MPSQAGQPCCDPLVTLWRPLESDAAHGWHCARLQGLRGDPGCRSGPLAVQAAACRQRGPQDAWPARGGAASGGRWVSIVAACPARDANSGVRLEVVDVWLCSTARLRGTAALHGYSYIYLCELKRWVCPACWHGGSSRLVVLAGVLLRI